MLIFDKQILYDYSQCQQCGVCEAVCPKAAISLKLLPNGTNKVVIDNEKCIKCIRCVNSCPANKKEKYYKYFNAFSNKKYFLGYNKDNEIRRNCSSGGVCKTLIIESLRKRLVDGVYTLKKTDIYPYAESEFYTENNIPQYVDIPNSIYHSVMVCRGIKKIRKCKRLIVVGTSCQLRAINTLINDKTENIIRVCIFCKQQKTINSTRFLAKVMGTKVSQNLNFSARYRGQGWPGIVQINKSMLLWNRAAQIPFGRRLWTVPGCNICGDSFGIKAEADLTLMDPWKIREPNNFGETLIIAHTEKGLNLLKQISNIILVEKTFEESKPALDLKDVWRKQQLVPFFRNEPCEERVKMAGECEQLQRNILSTICTCLPRMPIMFYRILCKLPDLRNKILK